MISGGYMNEICFSCKPSKLKGSVTSWGMGHRRDVSSKFGRFEYDEMSQCRCLYFGKK